MELKEVLGISMSQASTDELQAVADLKNVVVTRFKRGSGVGAAAVIPCRVRCFELARSARQEVQRRTVRGQSP